MVAIVVAYLPALGGGFIWDDDDYVVNNTTLRSLSGLARIWFEPRSIPQYYPLVHSTFWIEYQLWGLRPFGYHLVNVLLHAANAWLVWRLLARIGVPGAYLAAVLFGLHPVNVESVAWITERKNTLSGLFFLLSAYWFLAGLAGQAREHRYYRSSLVAYLAALLSKTVTATLPLNLGIVAWAKNQWSRALAWRLVPFVALGALLASVTVILEREHVGAVGSDWGLSFVQRLLIASRAVWFYLASLILPWNLSFIYPRWEVNPSDVAQYLPLLGCVLAGAVLVAGVRWWGRWPLAAALYFVVTLGPALGFVNVFPMRYTFVADHYQYLASIGPLALAAGILAGGAPALLAKVLSRQLTWGYPAIATVVCGVLAVLTWQQAGIYTDVETLWRDTLRKNPTAWMAHNNLGLLLLNRGDFGAAEEHFRAALRLKADDSFAMNNLGLVAVQRGRLEEATEWFQKAVREDPQQAEAANNWGNVLAQLGRWAEAEQAYREALRRKRNYPDAWNNLGNVLALQGRAEEALQAYQTALALDPDYASAYLNLARVLGQQGRPEAARSVLQKLAQRDPRNAQLEEALRELGVAGP